GVIRFGGALPGDAIGGHVLSSRVPKSVHKIHKTTPYRGFVDFVYGFLGSRRRFCSPDGHLSTALPLAQLAARGCSRARSRGPAARPSVRVDRRSGGAPTTTCHGR